MRYLDPPGGKIESSKANRENAWRNTRFIRLIAETKSNSAENTVAFVHYMYVEFKGKELHYELFVVHNYIFSDILIACFLNHG